MNDDNSVALFILIGIISALGAGYIVGFSLGEQFSQKQTINFCIEKPANCKIKYDYFKLEEQK